ncbi:pentapeptide repeat-containing protein [Amycolatopsis jiangsuensis]|uniref:Pentapeptide repeat protein n=1 Tax=Amycolatopsis jiangsuensis TaxID=1181879 RepID=A0A840J223_9PSEU|nr:pentapeptide repeat-containing protein [Amycolatopsis jiangsuensis]MBB4687537.1 hypothetical protein [Amycolatopsis jiangsuensis]
MRSPLVWTFAASVVLLCGVGGWLLTDPATSRADALKTGGLAAGAVVALYALWLNDRRRKVEEARQEVEQQRHELDRERISDERFARAVELLGHEADQVRVGAMHALAGLARSRPGYTQTVLDVLCAYLRRPFDPEGEDPDHKRERQVRLTAQRLIGDLLPDASEAASASYRLDLRDAFLESFFLNKRRVGNLRLDNARLHEAVVIGDCVIAEVAAFSQALTTDDCYFTCRGTRFQSSAVFFGMSFNGQASFKLATFADQAVFHSTKFGAGVWFTDAVFEGELDLCQASFRGEADLRFARMPTRVQLEDTTVRTDGVNVQLPESWQLHVDPEQEGTARIEARG